MFEHDSRADPTSRDSPAHNQNSHGDDPSSEPPSPADQALFPVPPPVPVDDFYADTDTEMYPFHNNFMGEDHYVDWYGKFRMYRHVEGMRLRPPQPNLPVHHIWDMVDLMFKLGSKFSREAVRLKEEALANVAYPLTVASADVPAGLPTEQHWTHVTDGMRKYCCRIQGDTLLRFLAFKRAPTEDPLTALAEFTSQYELVKDAHPMTTISQIHMFKLAMRSPMLQDAIDTRFRLVYAQHQTLEHAAEAANVAYTNHLAAGLVAVTARNSQPRTPVDHAAAGPSRPAAAPGDKYCSHHGNNSTHVSADCKVLQGRTAAAPPVLQIDNRPHNPSPRPARAPRPTAAAGKVYADQAAFDAAVAQAVFTAMPQHDKKGFAARQAEGAPRSDGRTGASGSSGQAPRVPCSFCNSTRHILAKCYLAHPALAIEEHGIGYRPTCTEAELAKFVQLAKQQKVNIGTPDQYKAHLDPMRLRMAERRARDQASGSPGPAGRPAPPPHNRGPPPPNAHAYVNVGYNLAAAAPPPALYTDSNIFDVNDSYHE